MSSEIKIDPIGTVENKDHNTFISIREKYRKALKELEGFSHIHIIWWGDRLDSTENRNTLLVKSPYKDGPDQIGIFATRSETRPNPVLISVVSLINVDQNRGLIHIPWIDAEEGSPVIDIKPYHPSSDRIKQVNGPHWCSEWPQWYEESGDFDWSTVFNF